jgi:hypothetical protein
MSTPYVAGLAGLIKSAVPSMTVAQLRAQIENNCDFVGNFVTKGRINALKAFPSGSIGQQFIANPSAYALLEGSSSSGPVANLFNSDNQYVTINSTFIKRVGNVSSIEVTVPINKPPASINSLEVNFEASAQKGISLSVYVWNYTTGVYEFVKAAPLGTTDISDKFTLASPLTRYVKNGITKVVYRAINPQSVVNAPSPFTLKMDRGMVTGRSQ